MMSIGIVGGGAWGTALAQTLRLAGRDVILWAREPETVDDINRSHTNNAFLPGFPLDNGLRATQDLVEIASQDVIMMVVPTQHFRAAAAQFGTSLDGKPVVLCSKGLEQASGKLLSTVLAETLPAAVPVALSGPSFAADVARGLPAALTLATPNPDLGQQLAEAIGYRHLRLYWSRDLVGTQLGGAIKNVLAIAAGIVDGAELGASAHAALVTRGFAELRRLGETMGADPETLMGLSGLGDLLLTCGSPQSRNMSLGRGLGQGRTLSDILGERHAVTEGVYTAAAVTRLAGQHGIEMPISTAVHAVVEERLTAREAIDALLARPFRAEA